MLNLSIEWLIIIANASLRTVLIVCIAMLALRLLRLRDANVRHRVWSGVMVGMLSLPLLSVVLPPVFLPFEVNTGWLTTFKEVPPAATDADSVVPQSLRTSFTPNHSPYESEPLHAGHRPFGNPWMPSVDHADDNSRPIDITTTAHDVSADVGPEHALSDATVFSTSPPDSAMWIRRGLTALVVIWLSGVLVLLLQIVAGLLSTTLLLRKSAGVADALPNQCCADVRQPFRAGQIRLMECRQVKVPVTVGWWKPTILLPESWRNWSVAKLEAVLAHETTHVARRDFLVAVLAEVNRCLYWFHPVSWWLRRKLSDLAEEACDDAAIGLTGNPAVYARHLLEVASALTNGRGRIVQPGMSMARESNVESRIMAILDFTRPLSQRLTGRALAVLLLVSVPVIALSAALQPSGLSGDADADAIVSENPNSAEQNSVVEKSEESSRSEHPAEQLRLQGQVTDNEGNALSNARVRLLRSKRPDYYAANPETTLIEDLPVDGHGRFDRQIDPSVLLPAVSDARQDDDLILLVSAPGHVYSARVIAASGQTKPLAVSLWPDVPITGRLLSLEGQPVRGVTVAVASALRADADKLDAWLLQASKTPLNDTTAQLGMMLGTPSEAERFPAKRDIRIPGDVVRPVQTDANGEFTLRGFGPDDLVLAEVMGSGVVKSSLHILGRDMTTVYATHSNNLSRQGAYYGRQFTFVTQPSVPVFGVVRDIDTKQPLANVAVAIGHMSGRTFSHTGYVQTTTDELGRYRIEGLPQVPTGSRRRDRNSLSVRPGKLPYIENGSIPIPARNGLDAIEFNIELRRAVLARGRLTDKTTGRPVRARIYYSPFNANDHVANYPIYSDNSTYMLGNDSRYETDEHGNFFVPVIAGRGVICAKAVEGTWCTSYGLSDIPEFRNGTVQDGGYVTCDAVVPAMYHSMKAIDVPTDVDEFRVSMEADPGFSVTLKFVDPNGNPLQGVSVSGAPGYRQYSEVEGFQTTVSGLTAGQARPIQANHEDRGLSRFIQLIPLPEQSEFVVQLFPKTVVTGRLVDPDDNPLAAVPIEARHNNDPEFTSSIYPNPKTTADGTFRYPLPVGATYKLIGQSEKFITVASDLEVAQPAHIDLGDLIVDPDGKRWAKVKPKREPTVQQIAPAVSESNGSDSTGAKSLTAVTPVQKQPAVVNNSRPSESSETKPTATSTSDDLIFRGTVHDPNGKPFASAKIHLIYWDWLDRAATADEPPLAISAADGSFEFRIDASSPTSGPMPGAGTIVAVAPGYGFAHVSSTRLETTGKLLESWPASQRAWIEAQVAGHSGVLQLCEDAPVRGRIVTTEGQPVPGALIQPIEISEGQTGTLDAWEAATQAEKADYYTAREELELICNGMTRTHLAVPPVRTNADGWFELSGLGAGRLAEVVVHESSIACSNFSVRATSGKTIHLIEQWPQSGLGSRTYYANDFIHVAPPSQIVVGRVTDRSTGNPIADCQLQADRIAGAQMGGRMSVGFIRTRTDTDGRFRLEGLPVGNCSVSVIPPRSLPYVALRFGVNGTDPAQESTRDIKMVQGTFVEGKVTDSRTGLPVAGRIEYAMFATNPLNEPPHRIQLAHMEHYYRSGPNGHYRIPVLPGPGVLGFNADDHHIYPRAKWESQPSMQDRKESPGMLSTVPYLVYAGNFHYVTGVDPRPDSGNITLDFQLTSGITFPGHVIRPDGTQAESYAIYGASVPGGWYQNHTAEFKVEGYQTDRAQRLIVFIDSENLVGTTLLTGNYDRVRIPLTKAGMITGRLISEHGEPVAAAHLVNGHLVNGGMGDDTAAPQSNGSFPTDSRQKRSLQTDDNGRFEIRGLVGGLKYSAEVRGFRRFGTQMHMTRIGDAFKDLILKPGEKRELGDIVLKDNDE